MTHVRRMTKDAGTLCKYLFVMLYAGKMKQNLIIWVINLLPVYHMYFVKFHCISRNSVHLSEFQRLYFPSETRNQKKEKMEMSSSPLTMN